MPTLVQMSRAILGPMPWIYCKAMTTRFWVGILTPAMRATLYLLATAPCVPCREAARRSGPRTNSKCTRRPAPAALAPDPIAACSSRKSRFLTDLRSAVNRPEISRCAFGSLSRVETRVRSPRRPHRSAPCRPPPSGCPCSSSTDQRRGLAVVDHQPVSSPSRRVVRAARELGALANVAHPAHLRALEAVVVARAALGAAEAAQRSAPPACSSSTLSSITASSFLLLLRQQLVRAPPPAPGCAETRPGSRRSCSRAASMRSAMMPMTISSGTRSPLSMIGLALMPTSVPGLHGRPQHVAGRQLDQAASGSPAPWPGFPCPPPAAPAGSGSYAPRRAPELGLLDQALVLVRQQMALDLRHRIHGHADGNQQRGAAEVEAAPPHTTAASPAARIPRRGRWRRSR